MGLFNKSAENEGIMNVIRCDEANYLIWKWHPAGTQKGKNKTENSIRWGSSLRVKEGEVAVFVCRHKGEETQDFIEGPFDSILKTKNLPVLYKLVSVAYAGDSPFQAEIYFINLAKIIQVRFGVPFFDVYDPRFSDFAVPVTVRGSISFNITDYREFIKLHRLNDFDLDDFQRQIKDMVCRHVKDIVANTPAANNIPVVQLEALTARINNAVETRLSVELSKSFGVTASRVDIGAIEIDKVSDGYLRLMEVTKNLTTEKMKAENADYIEQMRIRREEMQYAQHKQTQSANLRAFQIEKQAEVGVAGANALGRAGEHGSAAVNLGDGGVGFNPAGLMAGMAVGGALGKNITEIMGGLNAPVTPPPIPSSAYYVAVNDQPSGPYTISELKQLSTAGKFSKDSLVWKAGMAQWAKAGELAELNDILTGVPSIPPIPKG